MADDCTHFWIWDEPAGMAAVHRCGKCRRVRALPEMIDALRAELRATHAIVDEAQVVANCFNGDVLVKPGAEFARALDHLRTVLAAYVDDDVVADSAEPVRPRTRETR